MNHFLKEAYSMIKSSLHLSDDYYLIPCGYGTTAAIHRLSLLLGLYVPPALRPFILSLIYKDRGYHQQLAQFFNQPSDPPVVFVSPYEHHSNLLTWKESFAEVIEVDQDNEGRMDLDDLKRKLSDKRYQKRIKIGSFSAASNVTGVLTDLQAVTTLVKEQDGYIFYDFAAAAPYIDFSQLEGLSKPVDAFFFSPHKLLGGPGGCGILIIHKRLYPHHLPPSVVGGGTVQYVNAHDHYYLDDVEARENAGTPPIFPLIKTALALRLKDQIGIKQIGHRDEYYLSLFYRHLRDYPNLILYGPSEVKKRLPIVAFNIRDNPHLLHPKFVATLLNDLFGIQTRAGCACAGPYAHRLLGIDEEKAKAYLHFIKMGYEVFRPGFVRLNLHYTMDEEEVLYIIQAIQFVASFGHLFLSEYVCDLNTGEWHHVKGSHQKVLPLGLHQWPLPSAQPILSPASRHTFYSLYLNEAHRLLSQLPPLKRKGFSSSYFEKWRWFNFVHKKTART
ncbi:MAG TPA: aminotransferase class V-fold PLP-dependent enzyme [Haloplasmataceae bacterium]